MTTQAPTRTHPKTPAETAPPAAPPAEAPPTRRIADPGADPRSVTRVDAAPKVLGLARYTDDFQVPGAWHGATVRATEPHARLLGIDCDPDFDWSRVVLLTAADVPGENVIHLMKDDQPVLAADEICHIGEPVALVAAPTLALARAARDHVRLRTEPLPAVTDLATADHVFSAYEITKGDVAAGFAEADFVVEGTYRTGHQEQMYIETQAMIAVPNADGGVTVHGSLQCPYYVHAAMKRALGLDGEHCIVVQEETGGGFGGKEEYPSGLAIHAAMLALAVGRPVRLIYERHEDVSVSTKRHPSIVKYRSGVTRDGRLVAQEVDVTFDAGAYATLSSVVLSRGTLHAGGPYLCPNVHIVSRAVRTNMPPTGAFRGFGAPQTEFAAEMQVNRIAEALGISPAELRDRWAYRLGDRTATMQELRDSVSARECLAAAVDAADFETRRATFAATRAVDRKAGGARTAPGIGIAMGWHGAGFTGGGEKYLASIAGVELTAEGRVRVLADSTEIGQGMRTVFAQIVADRLGLLFEDVEVARQDTSVVPNSGPTVASRSTMVVGGLLATAADRLRAAVEARSGGSFAATYVADALANGGLRFDEQFGGYPDIVWDENTYVGDAYPCFGWAASTAEVEVDLDTGEVAVRHVVSADDCGTVINPRMAAGQVEGGALQSVGFATIEEMKTRDGRFLNDRLAKYLIPTALDAPRITAVLVENPFSNSPHGAKGLGELPMDVTAPAVVAAIHDATGAWIHELPATPERILAALAAPAAADRDGKEVRS
jgi:CO/xanthine dehydrogenase Mo-binding subunit